MPKPLENIRVLDLTRVLVGPFCTMILSDLGAEIIKFERPPQGDDSRMFGPFLQNRSLYFLSINRGKKSVTLNLKASLVSGGELIQAYGDVCVNSGAGRLSRGFAAVSCIVMTSRTVAMKALVLTAIPEKGSGIMAGSVSGVSTERHRR